MCNCMNDVNEKIKESTGDPNARVNAIYMLDGNTYPAMSYFSRRKKANGDFTVKEYENAILPAFCPFCGKQYNGAKDTKHKKPRTRMGNTEMEGLS